jgi:DNA-directed RNA polymerase specialized sigma24 family protein
LRQIPLEVAGLEPMELEELDPDSLARVSKLLDALPQHLVEVLVAHALHGTPKTEIAREIQVSRRTLVRYWQEIRQIAGVAMDRPLAEEA